LTNKMGKHYFIPSIYSDRRKQRPYEMDSIQFEEAGKMNKKLGGGKIVYANIRKNGKDTGIIIRLKESEEAVKWLKE